MCWEVRGFLLRGRVEGVGKFVKFSVRGRVRGGLLALPLEIFENGLENLAV